MTCISAVTSAICISIRELVFHNVIINIVFDDQMQITKKLPIIVSNSQITIYSQ